MLGSVKAKHIGSCSLLGDVTTLSLSLHSPRRLSLCKMNARGSGRAAERDPVRAFILQSERRAGRGAGFSGSIRLRSHHKRKTAATTQFCIGLKVGFAKGKAFF